MKTPYRKQLFSLLAGREAGGDLRPRAHRSDASYRVEGEEGKELGETEDTTAVASGVPLGPPTSAIISLWP